jgi:hypothetical protein
MVTTRTLGNAARSAAPAGYPNAAALLGVSGASHSNPSMAISRQGPKNAPRVNWSATGTATWEKMPASGSNPSRSRARVIPPDVGAPHLASQHSHTPSVPASRAATSS